MDAEEPNPLLSEDELQKVSTMNESIKCPNPECRAENPANAKFCRKCGKPIGVIMKSYTPDCFPEIELMPVSAYSIRFVNVLQKVSFVICPVLLYVVYSCIEYKYNFIYHYDLIPLYVIMFVSIIFVIIMYIGLKNALLYCKYVRNTDYIEENTFVGETKRIAKRKKLGLFDTKKKRILLRTKYDKITKYDDQHLQLENNSKVGIYSIPLRKIIVPLQYEQVMIIKNSVLCGVKDSQLTHYDTRGNVLQ